MKKGRDVCVIGVGMTKFERCNRNYIELVEESVRACARDVGTPAEDFEQAFCGYVSGMSAQGQRALYTMGLGGLPVFNVHNYCSTGSNALFLGWQAITSGMSECVLCFGFEKMDEGLARLAARGPEAELQGGGAQATAGGGDVRQRRPPAHGALRHDQGAVRQGQRQEPPPLGAQPALAVPRRVHARGGARVARGLRSADLDAVLPDLGRRRARRSCARPSTPPSTTSRSRSRSPACRCRPTVPRTGASASSA